MSETPASPLAQIFTDLKQVGDLLYAIDRDQGDPIAHWQKISVLNHRVRRWVNQLEEDTLIQLPGLAAFAFSEAQIFTCWGACADEIESLLSSSDS